jgi:uncharacterized coiled-coil protein SlyX
LSRSSNAAGTLAALIVFLVGIPLSAAGEDSPEDRIRELEATLNAQSRSIAEQLQSLEEERRAIAEQGRLLEEQKRKLEALRREVQGDVAEPTIAAEPDVPVPRPPTPVAPTPLPEPAVRATAEASPPASEPSETPATTAASDEPAGDEEVPEVEPDSQDFDNAQRPKSERPIDQLLVEAGGILLPNGALQVEPGFEWTHFTDSSVTIAGLQIFNAILIGTISVDRLDRDVFTTSVTARYGLFERFQIEGRLPFVIRKDSEIIGVGSADQFENNTDNYNIGDFEITGLYQPLLGRGWIPNLVLNLRARFPTGEDPFGISQKTFEDEETGETVVRLSQPPTGSGFFGVSPGFTAVWRSDPVVLFAGGSYTINIAREFDEQFGEIDPGDQLSIFAGINVSLSERIALNLSFADTQTFKTEQLGRKVSGSAFNDARIVLGTSINTGAGALVIAAVAGLTEQSPDVQVTVRVPLTWRFSPLVEGSVWNRLFN